MKKRNWPVFVLLLLAPICGELLSGSAPPVEFFNPIGFIILVALYGCGAVFIRELVKCWDKGWLSIFLLGMAYGIFEEGIVVRSFFDPAWPDLGVMAEYGRWLGVNWVWTAGLTIYHATISICIPILITGLLFPDRCNELWLSERGFKVVATVFFSVALLGPFFGMSYSFFGILGSLVSMAILAFLAYRLPGNSAAENQVKKAVKPFTAGLIGFASIFCFFFIFYGGTSMQWPAILTFLAVLLLPLAIIWLLLKKNASQWNEKLQWALAFGGLLPMILMAIIQELDNANRPDNTADMAAVGLITLVFMVVLGISVSKRQNNISPPLDD